MAMQIGDHIDDLIGLAIFYDKKVVSAL